jgi:hypothetical protein
MTAPWKTKATAGAKREVPAAGAQPAVLIGLVDLGTHEETYKDEAKQSERTVEVRKLCLVWELTAEKMAGMKEANHVVSKVYNMSAAGHFGPKSGLRKMAEAVRGKAYQEGEDVDVSKMLGKPFLITITHGKSNAGNDYAKIDGIGPVPKGMAVPPALRTPFTWELDTGDVKDLEWLPYLFGEKVADVVARSLERKGAAPEPISEEGGNGDVTPADVAAADEDQIPF